MNFRYIRLIIVLCCVAYPTFNKAEEAEEIDLLRQGAFEVDVGLRSRRIDKIYETPCQLLTVIDTTCKACPSNPLNTELSSYLGKVFTACELYRQHEAEIATYRELKSKKIRQIDMCNRQYPIGSSRIPVCKLDVHKKFNERGWSAKIVKLYHKLQPVSRKLNELTQEPQLDYSILGYCETGQKMASYRDGNRLFRFLILRHYDR